MALYFEVLNKMYSIHGLKNKYLQETFKELPSLHMNLDIKDGWLCETAPSSSMGSSSRSPNDEAGDKNDANVNSESKINSLMKVVNAKNEKIVKEKDTEIERLTKLLVEKAPEPPSPKSELKIFKMIRNKLMKKG
ncbi:hypothetical protein TrLO_g10947 [Triparma laevis f. longispina]|uniref:Uncharacterized protein n=2 Tax=Triparma laevis f. longispina TaxID=1714387 RepID=A0A9W7E732_9STRA|nr:hypothetical protein TrLO_g10947 [Triparma laevis f. longispina]